MFNLHFNGDQQKITVIVVNPPSDNKPAKKSLGDKLKSLFGGLSSVTSFIKGLFTLVLLLINNQ
jgi:hypothetical protein